MKNTDRPHKKMRDSRDTTANRFLVMEPDRRLLLDGVPCVVEVPDPLSELGSVFTNSMLDNVLALVREQRRLQEMWFGTYGVLLMPTGRNRYMVVRGCRTYLLWRAINPSPRNSLKVLVLPQLSSEEIAYHIAHDAFGAPLLHLLFAAQKKNESSVGTPRKGHRGNLMRTLNDALDNIRIPDKSLRQFLNLSKVDLECLGLELYYYRSHRRPDRGQERAATTSSETESSLGDERDAEVPSDRTRLPDSIPDERPDATATAILSDPSDKGDDLETDVVPDRTQICDETPGQESEISTMTESPVIEDAAAESKPIYPPHQEMQTSIERCHTS